MNKMPDIFTHVRISIDKLQNIQKWENEGILPHWWLDGGLLKHPTPKPSTLGAYGSLEEARRGL